MGETLEILGIYWPKLIAQIINISIVIFVLWRFAYKPVLKMLDDRQQKISAALAQAEQSRKEAAEAEERRKAVLAEANEKANQIIEESKKSADLLGQKKLQDAVAQAEALIQRAEEASKRDREKLLADLKKEVAGLVVQTTAKVLGKVITPEDDARLRKEVAGQVS